MNRLAFLVVLAIGGLCFRVSPASAQTVPTLWEPHTFSAGVGAGYEGRFREDGTSSGAPTLSAYLARPLTTTALVLRGSWDVVHGDVRVSPGVHVRFPVASEHFALALSYDFYAVNNVPSPSNEWSVGLVWGRQLARNLVLGASASYGLDTHDVRPAIQLSLPLHTGRN